MPFREYSPFFEPDELRALTIAYDAAWLQFVGFRYHFRSQAAVLKKNLAQIILASACNGERAIDRLKGVALKALT